MTNLTSLKHAIFYGCFIVSFFVPGTSSFGQDKPVKGKKITSNVQKKKNIYTVSTKSLNQNISSKDSVHTPPPKPTGPHKLKSK